MNFLVLLLFVYFSPAMAVTVSWNEAVKFSAQGNPGLEAAKNDWMAIERNEKVALAAFLPRLSAATSATRTGTTGQAGGASIVTSGGLVLGTGGSNSNINTNYLASLSLSQNLFNGLRDISRIRQAEWRTRNSFWTYVDAKSDLSLALKDAYSNLLFAQESLTLSRGIENRRQSNLKLVTVRYQNGRENKGSVLLAEAYYEQSKLDVIRARDALAAAQIKLKSLMNKEYLDDIEVDGEVPLSSIELGTTSFHDLVLQTPAYNQSQALEMASTQDISLARSNFLPTLDLSGNVTRTGEHYFPQRERWSVAMTLNIPIFDGFKDYHSVKAATLNRYAAEARRRNVLLDLLPRLKEAHNLARQSEIKYGIDQKFTKAAETRAEIARARYNNGLITFEDWDIIESELIQRQTTFLQSKRDRVLRYANWENLLGTGVIE
jgi:outer membrane protein TolC